MIPSKITNNNSNNRIQNRFHPSLRMSSCWCCCILFFLISLITTKHNSHALALSSLSSSPFSRSSQVSFLSSSRRRCCNNVQPFSSSSLCSTSSSTTATTATPTSSNSDKARGASLLIEDVTIYRGPETILKNVDWRIEPRTKWALIGANGSGKSTLLKAIVNEITSYDGNIYHGSSSHKNDNSIGYLQQTAVSGSNATIYDEAASAMKAIEDAKQKLIFTQQELENFATTHDQNDDDEEKQKYYNKLVTEHDNAIANLELVGGYEQEQKVTNILNGLNFNKFYNIQTTRCNELSGGWQMRVAFAKLLLSEPTLCLMDEPSNHLDSVAKDWLIQYLKNYQGQGSMILVTHDVSLLQSMDHIAEITPSGNLQIYKSCTYDQYIELKQLRLQQSKVEYEKNLKKMEKLQGFVDRFGASATKASAAQSRVKQIEKMYDQGLLDEPDEALTVQRFKPTIQLPYPPKILSNINDDGALISLKNADIGWGATTTTKDATDKANKPLLKNINLKVKNGMKLLIRGPNGCGKSTILHALRGTLQLMSGERIISDPQSLVLGIFTQDLAQELDKDSRAMDLVTAHVRSSSSQQDNGNIHISNQDVRTAMGSLGLVGDKSLRKIKELSGGEKARVALAMFALKPSNVYLLDEVSNHLDMECVEALGDALSEWGEDGKGAMVVVSHDPVFCQKIKFTHVATIQDGTLKMEERDARKSDWDVNDNRMTTGTATPPKKGGEANTSEGDDVFVDAAMRKQAYNAPKRIQKLESLIEKNEIEITKLDEEMLANGKDVEKLMDLSNKKEMLEAQILEYMNEWEELEELLLKVNSK